MQLTRARQLISKKYRTYVRKALRSIDRGPSGMFDSTNIETYGHCNRSCAFCFNNERFPKRKKGVMPEELWRKIIDELSEMKYSGRISPHFFGEPLMDKRIIGLLSYARKKTPYAFIRLNSNGDFLTEELMLKLIDNGVDYFLVTNYENGTNDNLSALCNNYPSYIRCRNHAEIELANRAGKLFDKSRENAGRPCLRPGRQLVINWEGRVLLCCNDYYAKYSFGNVKDEPVMKIWNSSEFKKYREILSCEGGRREIDLCRNCDVSD
ncbi:MAG: SPASM domain-containing protein [Nitrospirae bacterium]|nr:SPASM domain-containing protein [Nitrospirota bacterium]